MRRLVTLILACVIALGCATAVKAETLMGLQTCSEVPAFQERFDDRISSIEAKLESLEPGSDLYKVYQTKLKRTQSRFEGYNDLLCGEEGLPHLITDGRWGHAGEFILPGLAFLYLAGWLGWSGRLYLNKVQSDSNPEAKESNIDVTLALQCFSAALAWPLAAFKEIATGEIREKEEAVPISPR